jgi:hypothetical protein
VKISCNLYHSVCVGFRKRLRQSGFSSCVRKSFVLNWSIFGFEKLAAQRHMRISWMYLEDTDFREPQGYVFVASQPTLCHGDGKSV